jgi:acyl-CoA thioesterase-1
MKQLSIIGVITTAIVAIVAAILWWSGLQVPDERTIPPTSTPTPQVLARPTIAPTPAMATVVPATAEPLASPTPVAQRMLPGDRGQALEYVALGDSSVYGVGASSPERNYVSQLAAHLRSVYPQTHVINLGVPGATAADVASRQLKQAVAAKPNLITLSVGPNDITQGKDVEAYERNLNSMLRTLTEQTDAVIVVNLIPDLALAPRFSGALKEQVGRQTVRFNTAIERATRGRDLVVVDLYTPSQQEIPQHPEQLSADNYHPSDAGYARWAELIWQGLEVRIPT